MRLVRYTYPTDRGFSPVYRSFSSTPWSGLETEMGRLFEAALGDFNGSDSSRFPVDFYEDKENVYVRAELPGVDRSGINVEIVADALNISAVRKTKEGEKEQAFSLSRSVDVPENVQADKVGAAYENGVLTVTLPKKEEAKPRKVTVAVS